MSDTRQRVSVLVPFRSDGGGHRDRNWLHLKAAWRRYYPKWELIEGACPDGPWIKALAVEDAFSRATGEVLVLSDADVWCDGVDEAVRQVWDTSWAMPHTLVHRLTYEATQDVLAGLPIDPQFEQMPYTGVLGGGMTVITRALYEMVPLDPRFLGWGQEDVSAGLAWSLLAGKPWRGYDPLWHLWHPPMPRKNRTVGSDAGKALYDRYRRAAYSPSAMSAIIAEFKGVE